MNEEKLADLLAQHLDALIEEEPLPAALPAEITSLLAVAQGLAQAAPLPRPEFGPALKERLLDSITRANGTDSSSDASPPAGPTALSNLLPFIIIGLVAFMAISMLLIGLLGFGPIRSIIFDSSSTTAQPSQTQTVPIQPALASPLPPTSTIAPTARGQVTSSPISPTATTTAIIDILPQVTLTVVTVEALPLPPAVIPGPSDSSGGGGAGGGSNNGGGNDDDDDDDDDRDRGHGNDDDRYDEDNPGKKKN